jgi:Sulfatase-modifying factor enzyme 1/TIR domain
VIFCIYAREDRAAADAAIAQLRARGMDVQRDVTLVAGDAFWRRQIAAALDASDRVLLIWSRSAERSPWLEQEIRYFCGPVLLLAVDDTPLPEISFERLHIDVDRPVAAQSEELLQRRAELLADGYRELERFRRETKAPAPERLDDAAQLHDGTILRPIDSRRFVATTPVTNGQYAAFLDATGYAPPPTWSDLRFALPDVPVTGVTWFEAAAYAAWAGGKLLDRETWRLAATAGDPARAFATRSGAASPDEALFASPMNGGAPCRSADYPPNPAGMLGMCGNTWDWSADADGPCRVILGGSYFDAARFCRTTASYRNSPIDRDCAVGFRLGIELTGGT